MSKDYPTGEELDKMSDKEEWEDIIPEGAKHIVPTCDFVPKHVAEKKLAIERADKEGMIGHVEDLIEQRDKWLEEKKDLEAKVEKLKGHLEKVSEKLMDWVEDGTISHCDWRCIFPFVLADDAPEGGGEQ